MAEIKSFPNNQDEYSGAEDVMRWLHGRTSGVFAAAGNAAVAALTTPGMAVTVSDGTGWLSNSNGDGVVWWNEEERVNGSKLQLTIDAADGVLNRIDRVIVEWKTTNYVDRPEIKVLKGKASSTAAAPALTNNGTKRQISLAQISVAAGTTAIAASMITDERQNTAVCGLVTDSVAFDTSVINAQFLELLEQLRTAIEQASSSILPDGSVTTVKYADESVTLAKLAAEVTAAALGGAAASHTHGAADIASGVLDAERIPVLDGTKIADGTVTSVHIADKTITLSKFATDVTATLDGKRPRRNLLDNWYFANPVNQRGNTSYSAAGATIDRWYTEQPKPVSISANGITISGEQVMIQTISEKEYEKINGEVITVSVLMSDGTLATGSGVMGDDNNIVATFSGGAFLCAAFRSAASFQIGRLVLNTGITKTVLAVKVELGEGQTLAHQDASGNWVLNETPDYQLELLKCRAYYNPIRTITAGTASPSGGSNGDIYIKY